RDASGQPLGLLAKRVDRILQDKNNPRYTTFMDMGDHEVVINADKDHITRLKSEKKVYHRYTGYPGGLRSEEFSKRLKRRPEVVVQDAILGMLPKSKLGGSMASKLT